MDAHALCRAHHLRELKAVKDIKNRAVCVCDERAAQQRQSAQERCSGARRGRSPHAPSPNTWRSSPSISDKPHLLIALRRQGFEIKRPGHNLLVHLRDHRDDVLRFITNFTVPFTKNQAKRNLGMMKLRMKISGTFHTLECAQVFADIGSVISTVRKHRDYMIETHALSPQIIIAWL